MDTNKVLCSEQEIDLKQAANLHYGLTKREALKLLYGYANENGLKIPLNWENNQSVGNMWLRGIRQRFPGLTLRKLESTNLSRATSFNKENVKAFFTNLKSILAKHQFTPRKIYNMDETGNWTVHNPPKVLCDKN